MGSKFKIIGVFSKLGNPEVSKAVNGLVQFLRDKNYKFVLEQETARSAGLDELDGYTMDEIGKHVDLAVVVGGDGTMLNVGRSVARHNVPLVGVNLGRLGFLTDISADNMTEELENILKGEHEKEDRFLLSAEVMRAGKIVHQSNALNDVIINKGELARLIDFETFINGEFVNSMRADGIIVATPTGSTAYALSAGGPILHPTLPAMELVPICPHTLSDRPIVVSGDCVVEIVMTRLGPTHAHLTLDGQAGFVLSDQDHIFVRKEDEPVRLIHPAGRSHYNVLRAKLHWGEKL